MVNSEPQKRIHFTPQQHEIIHTFGQGQAVVAGAGCGKTTTLVAKCLRLLEENPKARVCAVSFTEKSVRDLKKAIETGLKLKNHSLHRHWVKTIHGLCSTIIQEFPHAAGLSGGERILLQNEAEELWERSIELLWTRDDSVEVSAALENLLKSYSTTQLEWLIKRYRYLQSVGPREVEKLPKSLGVLFSSVEQRYLQSKRRMGVLDFNDLELYAKVALRNASVAHYYHGRFDLVLVDEFQDTNPIQGEILEKFARPNFQNLCIVGDPKQSIYRFRDADVTVFYDLTNRLARRHDLSTNYRSHPQIIDWVNVVCAPLFEASALPYEPLDAGRGVQVGAEELEKTDERVLKLEVSTEEELAHFLKAKMDQGEDLSEYAILARSLQSRTRRILLALQKMGVQFLIGTGGKFFEDPRVQELIHFLKGMASPNHLYSQWVALRSPWVQAKETHFSEFFNKKEHPLAMWLNEVFDRRVELRPGEILERLMDFPSLLPEMQMPLLSLWHLCEEYSSSGFSFEEVVEKLEKAVLKEEPGKEVPPPTLRGAIQVMTIHASKGLEFKNVILIDFGKPYRGMGGFQDLFWKRGEGAHLFVRDENGERDKKDPENQYWKKIEQEAAVAESKRLFYVAITRAKENLYLLWPHLTKEPEADLEKDIWRGWVSGLSQLKSITITPSKEPACEIKTETKRGDEERPEKNAQIKVEIHKVRTRHSPSEWRILNQCERRYARRWVEMATPEENIKWVRASKAIEDSSGEASPTLVASERGNQVHEWLETENWSELKTLWKEQPEHWIETIREGLFFESDKNSDFQNFKELQFEVRIDADIDLVGAMDRLRLQTNEKTGKIHLEVIDFKWTEKAKNAEELFRDYWVQLKAYALAAQILTGAKVPNEATLSVKLLHLFPGGAHWVSPPFEDGELEFAPLQKWSKGLAGKANTLLQGQHSVWHSWQEIQATPGTHCAHCEWKNSCKAASIGEA